jgi:hypothetical protein
MTTAQKILQSKGPMLSGALVDRLQRANKITRNTASQKVTRDKAISKYKGFYNSGQAFCFLESHIKEENFFDKLLDSMHENGKKYWYCLNAIRMNGGILSQRYLECYTNYPILPLASHVPFKQVLQNFVSNGILIFNGSYYLIAPKFNQAYFKFYQYTTIEMIKDDILKNFHSYCRNIGLISFHTGELFAEFGKFAWGFKGVCPVNGLKTNNKFGYLLADILFGHAIHVEDVQFYIEKIKTIKQFKNASKILPFVLVDDLEPKALTALKSNGIIVGFIKELFGQKYAATLKELVNVLNNAGASLKKDPDKYLDLIWQLKKYNEGLANNIKGTLFEFVIAHIHSFDSNNSIDLGREIYENDARHDIDVLANYNDKVVFAECKATVSRIDRDEIDEWKGQKIPAFRKWAQKQETWKNKKLEFEYWATNGFDSDAEVMLKDLVKSSKKIKISYFTGEDLRARTLRMKNKKLKEALDNFFLRTDV